MEEIIKGKRQGRVEIAILGFRRCWLTQTRAGQAAGLRKKFCARPAEHGFLFTLLPQISRRFLLIGVLFLVFSSSARSKWQGKGRFELRQEQGGRCLPKDRQQNDVQGYVGGN